ncbi:MAG: LysR family transcriptional regulator [Acidobacteriota bacterium]
MTKNSGPSLDRFRLLQTFVRIAGAGSISAAARDLGLSQPSASRHLAELESRLETQLVRRTTHSLALTAAGRALLVDARRLLGLWESLEETHRAGATTARGRLTVVAPVALGQTQWRTLVAPFLEAHPEVQLDWRLEDHTIRFAEVGCDCWIKIGAVPDETLIVKEVGRVERLVVASPGAPGVDALGDEPSEAGEPPWLVLEPFESRSIPLTGAGGKERTIRPRPRLRTNNIFALREAALQGLGLAVLPRWFIADELADGRLIDCWPRWRAPTLPVHLAWLPGRFQPLRLMRFVEHVRGVLPRIAGIDPPF